VLELADRHDLGSCAARREGSSPSFPINYLVEDKCALKIETEVREDHQIKIVVEFDQSLLAQYRQKAARRISQEGKFPGFRPGKAPFDVVRRVYGDETITHKAIDLLIDEQYSEVIKEAKVEPSGPGSLEEIISEDPLKIAFLVPLTPEIQLGDYQSIRKDYIKPIITEEDIDLVIKRLRANSATAEVVDRPIQNGDLVYIKLKGMYAKPEEGTDAEFIKERPVQVIIGENEIQEDDWPYHGFSKELIGMKAKENKTLQYTYPKDEEAENLRGKECLFEVTVQSVKVMTLPEVNDEFAQTTGDYATLEILRNAIRQELEENRNADYNEKYNNELVDELVKISKIKYSPQELDEEIESVLHNIEHNLEDQHMDLETYLKVTKKERKTFIESEVKPSAIRRLERSLVLDEFARKEKIQLDTEALKTETALAMKEIENEEEFKKIKSKRRLNEVAQMITMQTANRLINEGIFSRIRSIATGQSETSEVPLPAVSETETDKTTFNSTKKPVKKKRSLK
jgi:trigger factor